jgi:peptide subunit release factor 1 (eRF1)
MAEGGEMILAKCKKCGCHFTIKDEALSKMRAFQCVNCCEEAILDKESDKQRSLITVLSEQGMELYRIPDNFEIRFSF